MKTALDTSVLLDVLGGDPVFGKRSREALRTSYDSGALVACDVVWAEVRAHFPSDEACAETLDLLGVQFDPLSVETAMAAGRLWRETRRTSAAARRRVVADVLIGAHAKLQADALLTRDRGFYRRYFAGLRVIDPASL
ncbi:MAG: type II toxin-antitoxin system VapC family toxin [Armatimonadota bacterium]